MVAVADGSTLLIIVVQQSAIIALLWSIKGAVERLNWEISAIGAEKKDRRGPSRSTRAGGTGTSVVKKGTRGQELRTLTCAVLRERLREAGKPISGVKSELIARLGAQSE